MRRYGEMSATVGFGLTAVLAFSAARMEDWVRWVRNFTASRVTIQTGTSPLFNRGIKLMVRASETPEDLLGRARAGDREAFGALLEHYHSYIRLLAQTVIGTTLRLRLDPSDLVQEAFLEAHRDFPQFTGSTERELLAWLRRILVRNLVDNARHQKARIRNHHRQVSLEALLEQSNMAVHEALAGTATSPSAAAVRGERAVLLAKALESLPADYREVIILRNLEGLKFNEVAARMSRSPGAVRMLWARALERLSQEVEERHELD